MKSELKIKHAVPPPVIYFVFLLVGLIANQFYRIELSSFAVGTIVLGIILVFIGLAIGGAAILTMRRVGVSPDPRKPPPNLVVGGAFKFSRNPIYISFAVIYAGISIAFNTPWPFSFLIGPLLIVDRSIIPSEERYLDAKFGENYRSYKSRVRRWI